MNKSLLLLLMSLFFCSVIYSQDLPGLKLSNRDLLDNIKLKESSNLPSKNLYSKPLQLKKRKAVNKYVGAGYSFVIFTDGTMNHAYPVVDTRNGSFLTDINLYFGIAIAQALTLEIEPSILFTNNDKLSTYPLNPPTNIGGVDYSYSNTRTVSMLAFPIVVNARFFPLFKSAGFIRLFFVGGGAGMAWIREEYDNFYTTTPGYYYGNTVTESTSQWTPVFRLMTGFTGSGGQFGFGGEVRYNIIPLKATNEPFATRRAANFNSVDLTLRFYFSL